MNAAEDLLKLNQKELDALPAEMRQKIEAVRNQVLAAQRLRGLQSARDSLLDYVQLSMPDPAYPDDATKSRYRIHRVHKLLAETLEKVERGEILRLIISVQPRVGKSQLVSKSFPPWLLGRDPYRQVVVTSYGEDLAKEFGRDVREQMVSPFYQQIFPRTELRRGSRAADRLQTKAGGLAHFVGIGGPLTGKGADYLLIDDYIKDAEEARSRAAKDKHWEWYSRVALSRVMGVGGAVVITATRWAEDDLIGRLTDPDLEYVSEAQAAQWTVINLPAFAEEDDPLGREPGDVLWEARTPRAFLENFRQLDPAGFAALYMGRPAPPEGNFFQRDQLRTYQPHQLPQNLRYYAASDHAVSLEQKRDRTCLGVVGVDEQDNIWVLPDLVWARLDAEDQTEAMLALMRQYQPLAWWAEKGHISQSIGPFLRKRMLEEGVFTAISEKTPVKDKLTRAQAIQARTSMGKVYFPAFAPWWSDALDELLTFPNGAHDDFVDFLAWIGLGLGRQVRAETPVVPEPEEPRSGTLKWILATSDRLRKRNNDTEATARYLQ